MGRQRREKRRKEGERKSKEKDLRAL